MTLARAALVLLASAAVLVIVVRLLEPRLAFFPPSPVRLAPGFGAAGPSPVETTTPRHFGLDFESLTVETRDGERGCFRAPGTSTKHEAPSTRHPF